MTPLSYKYALTFLLLLSSLMASAQVNCAVNAGSDDPDYCLGEEMNLFGNISGNIDLTTVQWELIQKPNASNVQILNPFDLNAMTTASDVVGTYVFRLSAQCQIGQAEQEVRYQVNALPNAEVEEIDDLGCISQGTILSLLGSIPGNGETVQWEILEGDVILSNTFIHDPELTLICGFGNRLYSDSKKVRLRYSVSSASGCTASKEIAFEYYIYDTPEIRQRHLDCDSCYLFIIDQCIPSSTRRMEVIDAPEGFEYDPIGFDSTFSICNPVVGDYTIRFINEGFCGTDTAILELYMNAMFSPVAFEAKDSTMQICVEDIDPEGIFTFVPDISFPDLDGMWEQTFGKPVEILDPNSSVLDIRGLRSGFYSFRFNLMEDEFCPQAVYIFRITVLEHTDFEFRNAGLRDELRFCSDLIDISGLFATDTFEFLDQPHRFELVAYPSSFDENDIIKFNIIENTINRAEDDSLCFTLDELEYEASFFANYLGNSNLFSLQTVEATEPGNYRLRLEIEYPCIGLVAHEIDINVIFKDSLSANAGTDLIVSCGQDSVELAGNLNFGIWTVQEAPEGAPPVLFDNINSKNPLLSNLVSGRYIINYSGFFVDGEGCNGEWDNDQVEIIISDTLPSAFDLGPVLEICPSEQYFLNLPDSLPFGTWSQVSGEPLVWNVEDEGISFSGLLESGEYLFSYTAENGCGEFSDTLSLVVLEGPLLEAEILTQDSCISFISNFMFPLSLEAETPGNGSTGTWSYLGTGTASFSPDPNAPNVSVSVSGASQRDFFVFIWTVENEACSNQVSDTVVFKQEFLSFPLDNSPYFDCSAVFPDTILITLGDLPDGADINWVLQSQIPSGRPPLILENDSDTITVIFYEGGDYSFIMNAAFESDCDNQEISEVKPVKLSESPGTAWAGEDIVLCGDSTLFNLTALPVDAMGRWSVEDSDPENNNYQFENPDSSTTTFSFVGPGKFVLNWSVFATDPSCGISSSDDIIVENIQFDITEDSVIVCGEEPIQLSISEYLADSVKWTFTPPASGATVRNTGNGRVLVEDLPFGTFTLTGSLERSSCEVRDEIFIQREMIPETQIDSVSYCLSVVINDELELPYIDTLVGGYNLEGVQLIRRPSVSSGQDSVYLDAQQERIGYEGIDREGNYYFRYSFSNGSCLAYFNWLVKVENNVFIDFPDTIRLCETSLDLSQFSDPNIEISWSPELNIDFTNPEAPIWEGESSEWLYVDYYQVGDTSCSNSDSIYIQYVDLIAEIQDQIHICDLPIDTILSLSLDSTSNWIIAWDNHPSIRGPLDEVSIRISPAETTEYSVELIHESGCALSLNTTVTISDIADSIYIIAEPQEIFPGESSQLTVVPGNDDIEYLWEPGTYLSDSTIYNPIASPPSSMSYTVTARSGDCINTASIFLILINDCKPPNIYVPNAFTPNGDNLNDTYKVLSDQVAEFYLAVYNRWGELVFESYDINEGWDGYYKGKKLNPDVYGYYLKIGCFGGQKYSKKGNITILY